MAQKLVSGRLHGPPTTQRFAPYARFRAVLLITGVLPLVLVPLILNAWPLSTNGAWDTSFVYVTGVLHVGMTSFFYLDPAMREFRRSRPHLFFTYPVVVGVTAAFALAVLPPAGQAAVEVAFAAWLGWHYTGQQIGIVALALKGEVPSARMRPAERRFVRWTAVVTVLGLVRTVDLDATPLHHLDLLLCSRVAFAGLSVALLALLARVLTTPSPGGGTAKTRIVALSWALAFVAPAAFLHDPVVGSAAIATVHGLHYVFLVAYLSRSRRAYAWVGTLALGAVTAAGYLAVSRWAPADGPLSHAAPCVVLTLVAAHRIVDTHVWRLRSPERVDYMRRSFSFL